MVRSSLATSICYYNVTTYTGINSTSFHVFGPKMNNKLGVFVRAHRERIAPESIGLPLGDRRRTPGLRREELATLCGVSSTWLTWLEQGRPVSASTKTLARLANALRLSETERSYLFKLGDKVDPDARIKDPSDEKATEVSKSVGVIQSPAYVLDRQWNAVAWNSEATQLFPTWLGSESPDGQRNLLQFMFLQDSAKDFITDWWGRARRLVAEFRAECGKGTDDPPIKGMVTMLQQQSSDFLQLWNAQEVIAREGGVRTFAHPIAGKLAFEQMTLQLQGRPDLKLTMLLPIAA